MPGITPDTIPGDVQLPIWVLIAAFVVLGGVIGYLVRWIRALYQQRITEQSDELAHRDALIERVLGAVSQLAEAMRMLQERARNGGGP